jgi:hypothetical protein
MSASFQMNLMAAPRLYNRLQWGDGLAFPLALSHPTQEPLSSRLSPSKSDNLKLVLEFHLGNHSITTCSPHSLEDLKKSQPNGVLHVPILSYKAHSRGSNWHASDNHIDHPHSRCHVLSCIGPTKLVVHASYWEPLPIRSIDQRNLREIVSWIDLTYPSSGSGMKREQTHQPFGKSTSNHKTVVYIISDMAPDGEQGQYSNHSIETFCQHLMEVMYRRHFATEILIVNGAGHSRQSAGDITHSCQEQFTNMEADINFSMRGQIGKVQEFWETRWSEGSRGFPVYKTMEDVEATTVQFLDSREYLENYNTLGEFTEEERVWHMGKSETGYQEAPRYRWWMDRRDIPSNSSP